MAQTGSGMTTSYPLPTDLNIATALQQLSNSTIVPSFFHSAELDLTTTNPHSMYDYQFSGSSVSNIDELLAYGQTHYSNNLLQDCSVQMISMTEYLSPNPVYMLNPPVPQCNRRRLTTRPRSDATIQRATFILLPCISQTWTTIVYRPSCFRMARPTLLKHIRRGQLPPERYG